MKTIRDLKVKKEPRIDDSINGYHGFIYTYGLLNCKILKFKSANEVLKEIKKLDATCLGLKDKKFILKNSNKEVLVYLFSHEERPDIFVFENNNIAFTVDCFL